MGNFLNALPIKTIDLFYLSTLQIPQSDFEVEKQLHQKNLKYINHLNNILFNLLAIYIWHIYIYIY